MRGLVSVCSLYLGENQLIFPSVSPSQNDSCQHVCIFAHTPLMLAKRSNTIPSYHHITHLTITMHVVTLV